MPGPSPERGVDPAPGLSWEDGSWEDVPRLGSGRAAVLKMLALRELRAAEAAATTPASGRRTGMSGEHQATTGMDPIDLARIEAVTEREDWAGGWSARRWWQARRERAAALDSERVDFPRRWLAHGPQGPHAGVVLSRAKTRPTVETTGQLKATYPFVSDSGPSLFGQFIGREVYSQAAWGWDPVEAVRRQIVSCPVVGLSGVIGSGKSSLLKTMLIRGVAFGRPFAVPGDIRGEYVPLGRALGANVLELGPGSPMRVNPLAVPPRPAGVSADVWQELVAAHRDATLTGMGEATLQRPLTGAEETGLELALASAVRGGSPARWAQPTLGHIADWLLNPPVEEITAAGISQPRLFARELRELSFRYRRLVRGVFAGVIDVDTTATLDMSGTGLVVDMSRLQLNDAALALVVTCTQSAIELATQFDPAAWQIVYDEVWRYMRFLGLLRRLALRVKVVRRMVGGIPLVAYHRSSDWTTGDPLIDAVAEGILKDIEVFAVYRQAEAELAATRAQLGLTSSEVELLPQLQQGTALWKVGRTTRVIEHQVLRAGFEWPLIDTDQPIVDGYRQITDPELKMRQALDGEAAA